MSNYQRLVNDRRSARNGGSAGGYNSKASRALAASVWKDVNRTMSPRRPGGRPGFFSASQLGGGGFVCPAHFAGGSKHAVFRWVRGPITEGLGKYEFCPPDDVGRSGSYIPPLS